MPNFQSDSVAAILPKFLKTQCSDYRNSYLFVIQYFNILLSSPAGMVYPGHIDSAVSPFLSGTQCVSFSARCVRGYSIRVSLSRFHLFFTLVYSMFHTIFTVVSSCSNVDLLSVVLSAVVFFVEKCMTLLGC